MDLLGNRVQGGGEAFRPLGSSGMQKTGPGHANSGTND